MDAANAVPVIGTPLAYGLGFAMLIFVLLGESWSRSLVTVAHEGGHMVFMILTFRGLKGFDLEDGGGGGTDADRLHWSISDLLMRFVGYPAPCVLGLGGALLVRAGHTVSVLWISLLLLVASFTEARNLLAIVVTGLATLGVGWAVFAGGTSIQVVVAVTLVWWMLLGGAFWSTRGFFSGTGDGTTLARRTWIPGIVWQALWFTIGVVCLWKGGRALLAL